MENNFGNFLTEKRKEVGLTQKQLAQKLFVSESAVSKWEKNVAHPDITLLPKLAEILGVTEHELITASVDKNRRAEKTQAKKWRVFSFSWDLFFYISYGITLLTCFICNLATEKTLSWFWIVLGSLLLAFTFTNLPKLLKKHKLILLPLLMFLALSLLLGVCCIYTNGNWFWIATFSVFVGLIMIFVPIYIAKYKIFAKIKKFNDFISIAIDFVALNILLVVINNYTHTNFAVPNWYLQIALPIISACFVLVNLFLCVRFLRTNKLVKTSVIMFMITLIYLIIPLVKVSNVDVQKEIDNVNIFNANFAIWQGDVIANNVHLIVFLTILLLALGFLIFGIIKKINQKK